MCGDQAKFVPQKALPQFVDPHVWGSGIGTKLLQFAVDLGRQRGFKKISLNVDLDNPRAERLYRHLGFKGTGKMTIGERTYAHLVKAI